MFDPLSLARKKKVFRFRLTNLFSRSPPPAPFFSPSFKPQVVSTVIAIIFLWGFVLWGLLGPKDMNKQVNEWKSWISYNFCWFYVAAFVSQQPPPLSRFQNEFWLKKRLPLKNFFPPTE